MAVLVPAAVVVFRVRQEYPYDPRVGAVRYVALGDSYTIGTSVSEVERWPNQLVERLRPGVALELVANLGVNGYASRDLIEDELPPLARLQPEFVTVLIGVNDVVQRVPEIVYDANLAHILDTIAAAVGAGHVVAISTPDYTLTPQGATFGNPAQQRARIARFNELMAARAVERAIRFVSIDSVANEVAADRSLVARDGLHPSGAQYARWVELIAPAVAEALATPAGPSSG